MDMNDLKSQSTEQLQQRLEELDKIDIETMSKEQLTEPFDIIIELLGRENKHDKI